MFLYFIKMRRSDLDLDLFCSMIRLILNFRLLKTGFFTACIICCGASLLAQTNIDQAYYLPDTRYLPEVPTPASFLGFEVGARHVSHDQLLAYMQALARSSVRVQLQTYGYTHEKRPLVCLIISDPALLKEQELIKNQRLALCDPAFSGNLDIQNMPAVWYAGYSIHGNEASGSNAALLFAYYLAAADDDAVREFLQHNVVLLDPCFNPDGLQRFSNWVNTRRSRQVASDPLGDEFHEPWPQGRTNHYWFDLNRDWLVAQQPESAGRVALLQSWKPNVFTDHHEMGSNSTFFFQPGVPSRVNPITPERNQVLTAKIAEYHARILDEKKILYFTRESYDDFYYGKGSTYPDANGGIGILFEQASSRGFAQNTENGLLTFPFTIRNQVLTSRSTMQAVAAMRVELNQYLRDFYKESVSLASKDAVKAILVGSMQGESALKPLVGILDRHRIDWRVLGQNADLNGQKFVAGKSIVVSLEQAQYRLIKGIFGHATQFSDSIFYDISAWTLPYAMGLDMAESVQLLPSWLGGKEWPKPLDRPKLDDEKAYAYALDWQHPDAPKVLARLLAQGFKVKVARQAFRSGSQSFPAGTLLLPLGLQQTPLGQIGAAIEKLLPSDMQCVPLIHGLTEEGPDLGSSKFPVLRLPKVLMITGDGVNPSDAGEMWHLLDVQWEMPLTLVDKDRIAGANLSAYNVMILPDGNYNLPSEKVREFVANGGVLIALGESLRWLRSSGLSSLEFRSVQPETVVKALAYGNWEELQGAQRMPGAIFEAMLDLSHPLCYGYQKTALPLFLSNTLFLEPYKNHYGNPVLFGTQALMAGYIHPMHKGLVSGSAALAVNSVGKGRIVCMPGSVNFRGFWLGPNRLLANALFFTPLVAVETTK